MDTSKQGLSTLEKSAIGIVAVLTVAAGIARYAHGVSAILAFVLAALALAGLAWIVSIATEQLGEHYGPAVTGTLQSTVGNLPEFFVVIFALQAHETVVAETAILGSILVNALLVLGLVLVAGSMRAKDGVMRFGSRLPNDTATLLMASAFMIALLGIANSSHEPAAHHAETISIVGAIAMLIVYGIWLRHFLTSESKAEKERELDPAAGAAQPERPTPRVSIRASLTLLVLAGVGSAFVSDWFVRALEPTIHQLHISPAFAGIVIVAIAGNAVENFAGIYLAWRGHSDLAISVVKSSVAQLAAFLYPLLVLVSLLTASHLTFALRPEYVAALVGTAILVWQITGDGEATPFEGAALIALYVVLATIVSFQH